MTHDAMHLQGTVVRNGLQVQCGWRTKTATSLILAPGIIHSPTTIPLSPRAIMPTAASTSTSHSDLASFFNAALESYQRKTKKDLASDPLLPRLQSCHSPEAILTVFREQIPAFDKTGDRFTKWVIPTVKVLHAFSDMLGRAVGLVNIRIYPHGELCSNTRFQAFPPADIIFAGINVLLSVSVSHDILV
jgi:hypothetical protein